MPGVVGPEDITFHPRTGTAYISSDDRRATLAGTPVPGAIFGYELAGGLPPRNLTPKADPTFHPHGIGLWVAPDGRTLVFVVNHPGSSLFGDNPGKGPGHTIEIFEVGADGMLVHRRRIESEMLISPNDIAPVGEDRFYVTNNHGTEPASDARSRSTCASRRQASSTSTASGSSRWPRTSATPTASRSAPTVRRCSSPW